MQYRFAIDRIGIDASEDGSQLMVVTSGHQMTVITNALDGQGSIGNLHLGRLVDYHDVEASA